MGNYIYLSGARPGPDLHDEVVEADRRVLDVESVASDLLAQAAEQPLGHVLVRRRLERGRRLVVEAVNPQGRRIQLRLRIRVVQDLLLAPVHVDPVLLVADQPDQRALELIKGGIAIPGNPDMRGPGVETVKRIFDLCIYPRRRPGITADVYDWPLVHFSLPGNTDRQTVFACSGRDVNNSFTLVRLFRSEGPRAFRRSRATGTPPGGRPGGSCTHHRHHRPPLASPVTTPARYRPGATTTMEHCRGHNHHDAPSSWSAGLPAAPAGGCRCGLGPGSTAARARQSRQLPRASAAGAARGRPSTVDVASLLAKLACDRVQAVIFAYENGLIVPGTGR